MKNYLLVLIVAITGCSSTTVIESSDPESRIYVNGEYLGTGQAVYSDQKVAFSKNRVEIRKDGCAPERHSFRRSEEADPGAIIGGLFLTFPFLWVTEYKPHRAYEFHCDTASI